MTALDLDTAKNLAIALVVVFVALAGLSAWLIRTMVTKLIVAGILVGLGLAVWVNRESLQDCADKVAESSARGKKGDTECSLFGITVNVPQPGIGN